MDEQLQDYLQAPDFDTNAGSKLKSVYDHSNGGSIDIGIVIKAIPYTRCYEVQVFGRTGYAYLISNSSSLDAGQGVSDFSSIIPGSVVICYRPDENSMFIIGTLPTSVQEYIYETEKKLTRATGSGPEEELHSKDLQDGYSINDMSGGSPTDALPGDWGAANLSGGAVMLSQFMAMIKAGETTGVWAYTFDKLLRIYGYNLEEFTALTERTRFNDEGEAFDVEYGTKYPWEALGIRSPADAFKDNSKAGWKPWKAGGSSDNYLNPVEPKSEDQTGLWRVHTLRGYLGDIFSEYVALPSEEYEATPVARKDNKEVNYAGLLREHKGADGSYSIKSAKEILLMKYPLIPVPQQKALPDNHASGDWHDNYKASGLFGEGPEPKEQLSWDWGELPGSRNGSFLDYLAYKFNWYQVANVTEHTNDWFLPEEKEVAGRGITKITRGTINPAKIEALKTNYWAELPEHDTVNIDHRMKDVNYYSGLSCLGMMDDGSVILEDAWGSQIIMSRGNITLSPAGDIVMRPGRSVTAWAGGDIVMRAKNNVELSSSDSDVRLKAEHNMHMLSGNGGDWGGLLLESRADSPRQDYENVVGTDIKSSGVVVKCPNSSFTAWAPDIFLSASKLDNRPAGALYLDGDNGGAPIITKSDSFIETVSSSHVITYTGSDDLVMFNGSNVILASSSFIVYNRRGQGSAQEGNTLRFSSGDLLVNGTIGGKNIVHDGEKSLQQVPGLDGQIADILEDTVSNVVASGADSVRDKVESIEEKYRDNPESMLSENIKRSVGFSFRNDKQYKIPDDFSIFVTRWQQYFGDNSSGWEEPGVVPPGSSEVTYPHPGSKWIEDVYYGGIVLNNFDIEDGVAKERAGYSHAAEISNATAPRDSYVVLT